MKDGMKSMNIDRDAELSLDVQGSIGERSFDSIEKAIKNIRPKKIIEFGSGTSSVRLANSFPDAKIISFDHHVKFFKRTRHLAHKHLVNKNLTIRYAPLRYQWVGDGLFLSYANRKENLEESDCVIIDGPPSWLTLRGREACLYKIYNDLKVGGLVLLDDYERKYEKKIIQNWLATYSGSFDLTIVDVGHQIAVLKKISSVKAHHFVLKKIIDNVLVNCVLFIQSIKRALTLSKP